MSLLSQPDTPMPDATLYLMHCCDRAESSDDIVAALLARKVDRAEPLFPLSIKHASVYASALTQDQIEELAHDKRDKECLDLEFTVDNPGYRSDFGQGCADLAEISDHGEGIAPGGCRLVSALRNCPVACSHELVPVCYDGMAPLPDALSPFGSLTRLEEPISPMSACPAH